MIKIILLLLVYLGLGVWIERRGRHDNTRDPLGVTLIIVVLWPITWLLSWLLTRVSNAFDEDY